jgi:hypothetical protein
MHPSIKFNLLQHVYFIVSGEYKNCLSLLSSSLISKIHFASFKVSNYPDNFMVLTFSHTTYLNLEVYNFCIYIFTNGMDWQLCRCKVVLNDLYMFLYVFYLPYNVHYRLIQLYLGSSRQSPFLQ